ncbi:protein of unknown function (plasmid) [Leuconostoc carnosum]|nr:protein of unknown function [Leuconostoc carnosum]
MTSIIGFFVYTFYKNQFIKIGIF